MNHKRQYDEKTSSGAIGCAFFYEHIVLMHGGILSSFL